MSRNYTHNANPINGERAQHREGLPSPPLTPYSVLQLRFAARYQRIEGHGQLQVQVQVQVSKLAKVSKLINSLLLLQINAILVSHASEIGLEVGF